MRILCIGDSNTWGFDPADRTRQDRRWTRLLRTWLKEDEIIEEGCNGRPSPSRILSLPVGAVLLRCPPCS